MAIIADLPPYTLLAPPDGSGFEGDYEQDLPRRHRLRFLFAWEDLEDALEVIAGKPETVSGAYVRSVPLQSPFVASMYARSFTHRGIGVDTNISASRLYSNALVDVTFETPRFALEGSNAYTSLRFVAATEKVTVPNTYYTISGETGADAIVEQNIGLDVGTLGVEISRHWVADATETMATLLPLFGTVNSLDVSFGSLVFPAGTLFLPRGTTDLQVPLGGEIGTTIAITLQYRSLPWNQVIRSGGVAGTLDPAPYATADHNAIFTT